MRRANGIDEFYSRELPNEDSLELFVDQYGSPTIDYPHVHIIHHGNHPSPHMRGLVQIVASDMYGNKVWRTEIPNFPDGHQVEEAVREARSRIW